MAILDVVFTALVIAMTRVCSQTALVQPEGGYVEMYIGLICECYTVICKVCIVL